MFLIDKETQISTQFLGEVVNAFKVQQLPKLNKYYNYYIGNQEILRKTVSQDWKPNNRIVANFPKYIVESYAGYLTGIDITYTSDDDIEELQNILNYNDVATEDNELLKNALIYGVAYELNWIDAEGKQRFSVLDSRNCIPLYFNDVENELAAVIRFYAVDNISQRPDYVVELYTGTTTIIYKSDNSLSSFRLVEDKPNYFNQVPISVFQLNEEGISIFEPIIGLQDAYNTLLSSEVDDWEAFCNSYLALIGFDTDEETIKTMKENRVLVIPDGGEAKYIEKNPSNQQIESMLNNIEAKIHKISACPDFTDTAFGTSSGIALKYKLLGFENAASSIEKRMTKVLQRRIELLCSIINLVGEDMWRDIQIIFTRNIPVDYSEVVAEINTLRGLVSDKTLISQLAFIQDVDAEMNAIREQKEANAQLYNYSFPAVEEDE